MVEVAVSPLVQKSYRDHMKVPDAPSFIETNVPITPVIALDEYTSGAFLVKENAANNNTTTLYTVPANKKFYIIGGFLTAVNGAVAGGIGTIYAKLFIGQAVGLAPILRVNIDKSIVGGNNTVNLSIVTPIVLSTGDTVQILSSDANCFGNASIYGYEVDV